MTDIRQIVARAVEIYPRNVDVRDFGAVGDGKTDDTAAFQAAIDFMAKLAELWPKITERLPDAVLAAVSGAVGWSVIEAAARTMDLHWRKTSKPWPGGAGHELTWHSFVPQVEAVMPIIALAARDAALEEAAKWLRVRAAASNIGERDGALVENELDEAADDMLRALKGGPARG